MSFLSDVFGSKPQIADYQPIDLSQEQQQALQANIDAFPQIAQMGDMFQNYLLGAYNKAIPGFGNILKMGGQTTQQMLADSEDFLKGKIPQDVQDQIQRSSAYTSLMAGTAGSGMSKALTARDFGLTSLNLINQGANLANSAGNAAQRWAALSGAQIPEGMLVTPQQKAQLDMQQNLIKQATQQARYNVAAAPDPALQALNQWVEQVGGSIVASYAGGKPGSNYKTGYDPAAEGAPAANQMQFGQAFGSQMEQAFPDSGGMPPPTDTGYIPTNSYLPNDMASGYNASPYYGAYGYGGTPPPAFGGTGVDWGFNPYGG